MAFGIAASTALASVTLTLSPVVGPPATLVKAKGKGFPPGASVTITFDSTTVATASTNAAGAFAADFTVPATALPGTHAVAAFDPAGLGGSATFLVQTEWGTYRFSDTGSGFNPYENVLTAETVGRLQPLSSPAWAGHVLSAPIYTQGMAVVGSDDGTVRALDPASGNQLWSFQTGGAVLGSPLAVKAREKDPGPGSDCAVVAASTSGMVYGLEPSTGRQIWSYKAPGPISTSPVDPTAVEDIAMVAVQEDSALVFALNGCTGAPVWSTAGPGPITSTIPSPAELAKVKLPDGTTHTIIIVCFGEGTVSAFDAATGAQLWTQKSPGPSGSPSAYGSGTGARILYAAGGSILERNASTGALLWSQVLAGRALGSVAIASRETLVNGKPKLVPYRFVVNEAGAGVGGFFYFTDTLELQPGKDAHPKLLWRTKSPGPVGGLTAPAVAGGVVYTVAEPCETCAEGTLQALDASTGAILFTADLGEKSPGSNGSPSPSVADGRVYVGGFNGGLRVLGLLPGG